MVADRGELVEPDLPVDDRAQLRRGRAGLLGFAWVPDAQFEQSR
ncbi:hypothetical protein [Pseudonocardia phyllosphaerae]